jgi:hypothetical protein
MSYDEYSTGSPFSNTSRRHFFIFSMTALFFTPLLPRTSILGGLPLGIHHLFYLVLSISLPVFIIPELQFHRNQIIYIFVIILLPISIFITGLPNPDARTVISHSAVVTTTISVGVFFTTYSDIYFQDVNFSLYMSGVFISLWDILVIISPLKVGSPSSSLIPYISTGGIAPPHSLGTHGIVVGIAIIAGLHILRNQRDAYISHHRLIPLSIGLMLFAILTSGSRSSLMAIILGVSFYYLVCVRSFRRETYFLLSILCIFVFAGLGYFFATLRLRTVLQRIEQNLTAIELTLNNPYSGVGWQEIFPQYLSHVIHNTVLNYFAAGGIAVGILFLFTSAYPLSTGLRALISRGGDYIYTPLFVSMWFVTMTELMLYKSTPNIYLFVIGMMICIAAASESIAPPIRNN